MGLIPLYEPLKAESFLWLAAERRIREVGSRRIIWRTLADFKVEGATGEECRPPSEAESGALLTAGKGTPRPPSYNHEKLKLPVNLNELGNGSLLRAWSEEFGLANVSILALFHQEQRTPASPPRLWPIEIWADKWVLFEASCHINLMC